MIKLFYNFISVDIIIYTIYKFVRLKQTLDKNFKTIGSFKAYVGSLPQVRIDRPKIKIERLYYARLLVFIFMKNYYIWFLDQKQSWVLFDLSRHIKITYIN